MWPTRIILWPHGLLYIERRFCKLNHPRIVHSCNVLEVSPSKWLISKALISLFFSFWSWFHNKVGGIFDRRNPEAPFMGLAKLKQSGNLETYIFKFVSSKNCSFM